MKELRGNLKEKQEVNLRARNASVMLLKGWGGGTEKTKSPVKLDYKYGKPRGSTVELNYPQLGFCNIRY